MGGGACFVHYTSFMSGGLVFMGRLLVGRLSVSGLIVGWDVICGHGGAVSGIVCSPLVRCNAVRWARYSLLLLINNNEQQ